MKVDLTKSPYYLSEEQIQVIEKQIKKMTTLEKIGQLFFIIGPDENQVSLEKQIEKYHPGGVMYRPDKAAKIKRQLNRLNKFSEIPLLTAANLESGGNGIISEGTYFAQPLGIAATDKVESAYRLGAVAGKEAHSVGVNMHFGPIVDVDYNFRNPITNVRTYGSEVEKIIAMTEKQIAGLKTHGVISCIKHFPGDGVDERDQHLLPSVNSLSISDWEASYGKIYRYFINQDVPAVMIAHILHPAYYRKINHGIKDEAILPASLSSEIVNGLLRSELGFQGLAITDATPMMGYNVSMPRSKALPATINAGVDMILFNKNIDEDYEFMIQALETGELSMVTIENSVRRILGTKIAQGVWNYNSEKELIDAVDYSNICSEETMAWVKEVADESVTLVKDTKNILPLTPKKYPRIRLYILGDTDDGGFKSGASVGTLFFEKLSNQGFEVSVFNTRQLDFHEVFEEGVQDLKHKFDLALYIANVETASNQTTARVNWVQLMAANAPWFMQDIPTVFVSTANPYHLFDVPMISTFINAYSSNEPTLDAIISKLIGKSDFKGISPIDPFVSTFGTNL